jgi:diadenosine tetraphosphate (Ap4A) HIT family hydrolase
MNSVNCPFCIPSESLINNDLAYVVYDKYPVSAGHILIIPYRHVSDYFDLTADEKSALQSLLEQSKSFLVKEHNPDGFNIGINVGEAAGQTVWHVHMHLIPRYSGDMENPRGGVRGVIPDKQNYHIK